MNENEREQASFPKRESTGEGTNADNSGEGMQRTNEGGYGEGRSQEGMAGQGTGQMDGPASQRGTGGTGGYGGTSEESGVKKTDA